MKIKNLRIKGFKRFKSFSIEFNDKLNVIVGENEIGKSTILEALNIVLNRSIFSREDTSLIRYFNTDEVKQFFRSKRKEDLPKVDIEVELDLVDTDQHSVQNIHFAGLHYDNHNKEIKCGIKFKFDIDEDLLNMVDIEACAENRIIPIEYYKATWSTFSGKSYKTQMLPMKTIFLDTSEVKSNLYGSYARKIYIDRVSDDIKRKISNGLNSALAGFKNTYDKELTLEGNRVIGLDANKTDIYKLVDIYENDISVQDMGRGKENIVKTEIALNDDIFHVVCIEEPETHLSHSNTRMLVEFIKEYANNQLILTSHSSMIVSRLNIENVIWIADTTSCSLKDVGKETAQYFQKLDRLDILRFILSKKVILVEGAAEYIVIPTVFKSIYGKNLDEFGIEVISMGGITYKHYQDISKLLNNKRVVVITDNDGKEDKTKVCDGFAVFSDSDTDSNKTFESALYNNNEKFFNDYYKDRRTEPTYKGKEYPVALAHMLKNKTDNAIAVEQLVASQEAIVVPQYIKDALEWIKE